MAYTIKYKPMREKRISQYYKPKTHKGIDLAAPTGTPVYATCSGTVVSAKYGGWDKSYGNMVAIYHGNGDYTNHAHLSEISVKCGNKVTAGQLIGYCGSTGHSTGPHLHFEVHKGRKWNRVNPKPYLDKVGYVTNPIKATVATDKASFTVGDSYTLLEDMNVRIGHGVSSPRVAYSKLSEDAQKHANKDGTLKTGTKITCKDLYKAQNGEIWVKSPSGWICAVNSTGKAFVK